MKLYTGLVFIAFFVLSGCSFYSTPQYMEEEAIIETPQRKLTGPLIIIDPGHGGKDLGTEAAGSAQFFEKHLTLTTSKMLKQYLQQLGFQAILTRNDDFHLPLSERTSFANARKAKLFVSVHYNSAPSKEAQGIEVYYYKSAKNPGRMKASKELASAVLAKVVKVTGAKSRGIKTANFAVIRETNMPAILIEGGFLTNKSELRKLKQQKYLKKIAEGIAQGIQDHASKKR